jgi:hypothetical protein
MVVNIKIGPCSAAPAALPDEPAANFAVPLYNAGQYNTVLVLDEHGNELNTIDTVNKSVSKVESKGFYTVDGKKVPGQ